MQDSFIHVFMSHFLQCSLQSCYYLIISVWSYYIIRSVSQPLVFVLLQGRGFGWRETRRGLNEIGVGGTGEVMGTGKTRIKTEREENLVVAHVES